MGFSAFTVLILLFYVSSQTSMNASSQALCILLQILFSDALLEPTCHIVGIEASGHDYQGQCWTFSTEAGWQFEGNSGPQGRSQQRFVHLLQQILTLFSYPTALSQPF